MPRPRSHGFHSAALALGSPLALLAACSTAPPEDSGSVLPEPGEEAQR